jgi:formylglycine-generating enzyme required for sulfatase activity
MILISSLDFDYYIDSTEVTVGQYRQFLDAKGADTSGQPPECSFNTSFRPEAGENVGATTDPMTYVDWCDATAFCSWAGKRLCGKIGGGPLASTELEDGSASQWYLACAGPLDNWLPSLDGSGDPATPCRLNDSGPAPVGTTCEGSYPGLFEMVGNVAEWQDFCEGSTGSSDMCYLQGAGWVLSGYCYTVYKDATRNQHAPSYGFRCCSG